MRDFYFNGHDFKLVPCRNSGSCAGCSFEGDDLDDVEGCLASGNECITGDRIWVEAVVKVSVDTLHSIK